MMELRTSVPIKVFLQRGCASCLRPKASLGVHFVSVNVLEDGFKDLERFDLKHGVRLASQ